MIYDFLKCRSRDGCSDIRNICKTKWSRSGLKSNEECNQNGKEGAKASCMFAHHKEIYYCSRTLKMYIYCRSLVVGAHKRLIYIKNEAR